MFIHFGLGCDQNSGTSSNDLASSYAARSECTAVSPFDELCFLRVYFVNAVRRSLCQLCALVVEMPGLTSLDLSSNKVKLFFLIAFVRGFHTAFTYWVSGLLSPPFVVHVIYNKNHFRPGIHLRAAKGTVGCGHDLTTINACGLSRTKLLKHQ